MDRLEDELRESANLPLTWFEVLLHLSNAPEGRLRMSDLAQSLLLSKSGVTRLVDRMEEAGLVTRGTCPSDRRGSFAVITVQGRSAFEEAAPVHFAGVDEHFLSLLNKAEARALTTALGKVLDAARDDAAAAS